ncbi:MAG: GspH/FimT family pseudopilin [Rubrivivax sp.]
MKRPRRGFTLIELMVVIAIAGVLLLLAAPSFRDMIQMQRLRGASAQFVTDMQFARSQAVAQGRLMRVVLGQVSSGGGAPGLSCYTIFFTNVASDGYCDCTRGVGSACSNPLPGTRSEVRTVVLPHDDGVDLVLEPATQDATFAFDPQSGGLLQIPLDSAAVPLARVTVDFRIDDARRLRTTIIQSGRPTVCAPDSQRMQLVSCPTPPPGP